MQSMRLISRHTGSFYAAESAVLVGEVQVGKDSSIWHHCVVRGDVAPIRLGQRVNIQDGAVLHCQQGVPLELGDDVIVGHGAVVHGKRVGSRTLIGIQAAILDGCEVGDDCLLAAGTVLPPGTSIPEGSVVMGSPGKVIREIRAEEKAYIRRVVESYVELARQHVAGDFKPIT